MEVEVGVHEIRSRFTPSHRPSSRQITGHKVLNLIPIKNNIYTWGTEEKKPQNLIILSIFSLYGFKTYNAESDINGAGLVNFFF